MNQNSKSVSYGVASLFFSIIYDCCILFLVGFNDLQWNLIIFLIIVGFIINYILNYFKIKNVSENKAVNKFRCFIIDSTLVSFTFYFLGTTNTPDYTNLNSIIFTPFFYLPLIYSNKYISNPNNKKITLLSFKNLIITILYCYMIYLIM